MIHRIRIIAIIASAGLVSLAAVGCKESGKGIAKRGSEDDAVYGVESDDPQMNAAVAQAKATVGTFIAALDKPKPNQVYFSIKKPFPTPDGSQEHIWLNEVTFDGAVFHGNVANTPIDVPGVGEGDQTTVGKTEISDWMIVDNTGKVAGAYTMRVIRDRMTEDERRQFDRESGLKLE